MEWLEIDFNGKTGMAWNYCYRMTEFLVNIPHNGVKNVSYTAGNKLDSVKYSMAIFEWVMLIEVESERLSNWMYKKGHARYETWRGDQLDMILTDIRR